MTSLILIVDDEPGLIRLFTSIIERGLNYRTLQAAGGESALKILEQETPDLMLLDLAMPLVDGYTVLQKVRANPRLEAMKIIVLTARPRHVSEIEALDVDSWLTKPVAPADLLETIQAILATDPPAE